MTQLQSGLWDNMRKMVTMVDELRDVGVSDYIKLPRICVLGTQSAGKSSLLENVVGLDFLPRGDGVVTRRPLELRLVHRVGLGEDQRPWAVFDALPDRQFFDFLQVRDMINELTDKDAGKRKGIIKEPIKLTVYSPDCPDLTIIDLPGITKIPLKDSDQPENIEQLTKELCQFYCEDERTIILCVIPANQDMSTSEALQMARKMDREGMRTFGVITKIDIMDQGTDARKLLLGQDVELRLGYVGVKNRSQEDIRNKVGVQVALKKEDEFFQNHPSYQTIPKDILGTKALIAKLSAILFQHIRHCLPEIMDEIDKKVFECEDKMRRFGPTLPVDQKERMQVLYNMLQEFTENFKNTMRGRYDRSLMTDNDKESNQLTGAAKIKQWFNELYEDRASQDFKVTSSSSDKDIERAITLHQGDSIPGFPSFDSFLYLLVPKVQELKEPAIDLLFEVFSYMDTLSQSIIKRVFVRFPTIIDEINELSTRILSDQRDKAKSLVENQLSSELDYIFTNDNGYLTTQTSLVFNQNSKVDPTQVLVRELRSRVDAYYRIIIRNLRDSIPKYIGHFLVKVSQEKMQFVLYNEMLKNQSIMGMLEEPAYITQEREMINKTLNVLKKAQKLLKKDPDLAISKADRHPRKK